MTNITFTGEYDGIAVNLEFDSQLAVDAGITLEQALLLVLKYYAARQVATGVRKAQKEGKPIPAFEPKKFISWMLSERSGGEPTKEDLAFGEKAAKRFMVPGLNEREEWAKIAALFETNKAGFRATPYDEEVAYNDSEVWAKEHRRFRLFKVDLLAGL